jgi:hypothetical protein
MTDYSGYIVCGILSFPCICCCIFLRGYMARTRITQEPPQPKPSLPPPEPPCKTEDPLEIV